MNSTMENGGTLMEYPEVIENLDMQHYYERKYDCPWRSIKECAKCENADCPRRIQNESEE